jgi:hypothetical protein
MERRLEICEITRIFPGVILLLGFSIGIFLANLVNIVGTPITISRGVISSDCSRITAL